MGYRETLAAAKKVGASKATDPQLMALYCDGPLQTVVGAVSPKLVWEGAQTTGLTTQQLMKLSMWEVNDLQWV